jgi:Protein of unknown function (DUF1344)
MRHGLVSLLVAVSVAMIAMPGQAQTRDPAGPTVEGQEVEGTVQRIDPQAGTLTLDDGQDYLVPPTVLANPRVLGEGTIVRLRFDTDGGRNYVTSVQVLLWRPAGEL